MKEEFDLLGWDTVFGISYTNLNKAIIKNKSTPVSFNYVSSDANVTISGSWRDWQLTTGGDGKNLQMSCPIISGTVTSDTLSADLKDSTLIIQVNLSQIPDPGYPTGISPGKDGTPHLFMLNANGTIGNPSVSITGSIFPSVPAGILKEALPSVFQEYFIDNIAEFNHVFAVVDLNLKADTGDYQWLMPTSTSYACAQARDKSLEKSVFGVLCTTDNASSGLLQQGVDARILEDLPAGTNSRFLINQSKVLQHILLPGAVYSIQGSTADDFHIENDNNWIVNNKDLTWGNFEIEDGKKIAPKIETGNFQFGVENNFVVVKIIDAQADWTGWHGPGDIVIHLNMTQHIELDLRQTSNGWILIPKPLFEKNGDQVSTNGNIDISCDVSTSEGVQIFEICTGIAASIIGSILGSILGSAIDAASTVAVKTVTEGAIEMATVDWIPIIARDTEGDIIELEQASFKSATEAVEHAGDKTFLQSFKAALSAEKWKLFGGILGSVLGSQIGLISTYMKLAANDDFDQIPTFDNFASNCTGTTVFPGNTQWTLKGAGLQGPLVISGDLMSAD